MNIRKYITMLFVVVFTCSTYNYIFTTWIHAEKTADYEQASIAMIDNLDEYDSKAPLSWSCELNSQEGEKIVSNYATFTLKEDCIIKMGIKYTDTKTVLASYASADVFLYSNRAMTRKKLEFTHYDEEPKSIYLPAGTYYIEVADKKSQRWVHGVKFDISVCALPVNKALSVTAQPDKDNSKAVITVTQAFGLDLEDIQYTYGVYDKKDDMNYNIWIRPGYAVKSYYDQHIATVLTDGNTFTVNKNGIYTIRVSTKDGTACSVQYKIKGLRNTASQRIMKNTKTILDSFDNTVTTIDNRWGILFVIVFLFAGGMFTFVFVHEKKILYYKDLSEDYKEQFAQEYSYFKDYKKKQSDMVKFRHDWKNHMLLLQEMLNYGEYEKAKEYFDELSEKTVQNKQEIFTGNEILDLILVSKTDELEKRQIKLTFNGKLELFPFMENVDCCILFSSLIDSAMEANLKLRTERYITIQAYIKDQILIIEIRNPIEDLKEVIETRFQTTKKDVEKHGFGLRNIYEILKKYHIKYNILINEQEYSLQMSFKI